jgi:hypothetical protein
MTTATKRVILSIEIDRYTRQSLQTWRRYVALKYLTKTEFMLGGSR